MTTVDSSNIQFDGDGFAELIPPLEAKQVSRVINLWSTCFGEGMLPELAEQPAILLGADTGNNCDCVVVGREVGDDDSLVVSAHATINLRPPWIAGLGEVVTDPEFRRRGLASAVCVRALDFARRKSEGTFCMFLGASDAPAQHLYHKLGWRKLAGSTVRRCGGECGRGWIPSQNANDRITALSARLAAAGRER